MVTSVEPYLRQEHVPHIWCPGCGNGIALAATLRAIDDLSWDMDKVVMVSGIGCSSRATGYVDACTLHTTHGRAIPFATGIKMARPDLKVVVTTGDGDAAAIGGNHLIHAARRNMDLTVILYNNHIYGMTGGQCSPATPWGDWATTAPHGNVDHAFDISAMVAAAGPSLVARQTVYHLNPLQKLIRQALDHSGFSMVEAMTPCPTAYGRKNKLRSPVAMMEDLKKRAVPIRSIDPDNPPTMDDAILTGIIADRKKPEYAAEYLGLIERLRAGSDR